MVEFARGNPQWPQAFYPVTNSVTLVPGDFFVARCTYNTTDNPNPTFIGTKFLITSNKAKEYSTSSFSLVSMS